MTYANFTTAKNELNKCWTKIDTAINSAGRGYKLFNVYAIDVYLFFILVIV